MPIVSSTPPTAPPPVPDDRNTRSRVKRAADELLSDGHRPTVANVRAHIGRGSATTINAALNEWWQELGDRLSKAQSTPPIDGVIVETATRLWEMALEQAHTALAAERAQAERLVSAADERAQDALLARDAVNEQLTQLTAAHQSLDYLRIELERQLAALQGQHAMAVGRIDELQRELRAAVKSHHQTQAELQELFRRQQGHFSKVEQHLTAQLADERTGRKRSEGLLHDAQEGWRKKDADCQRKLFAAVQESAQAKGQVLSLQDQLRSTLTELNQSRKETEQLIARTTNLEANLARKTEDADSAHAQLETLRQETRALKQECGGQREKRRSTRAKRLRNRV